MGSADYPRLCCILLHTSARPIPYTEASRAVKLRRVNAPLPTFALFDNNLDTPHAGGTWLLTELRETIVCRQSDDWQALLQRLEEAARSGAWVALAATYELGYLIEPRLRPLLPAETSTLFTGWIFERGEWLSDDACDAWLAAHAKTAMGGTSRLEAHIRKDEYLACIARVQEYIAAGDCYQVNVTFPLSGRAFGDPASLYRTLRQAQPVRYGAFISHPDGVILSRSPELFLERRGNVLSSQPMKGTAPRHVSPEVLADSAKDRAENVMIVDLIRNDMGRLAPPGGVRVEDLFRVDPYPTVWQMTSRVIAEPVTASLDKIFTALFPCGSITGAPKIRAMEIIRELEPEPRGLYCGALGWIRPGGDFRFSVPIRTLLADRSGQARLNVGSGVVHDSLPVDEWTECHLKSRFLTAVPKGLRLIETLRYTPGDVPFPFLPEHLARIQASADTFGFPFSESAFLDLLRSVVADEALRVRITLGQQGDFTLETVSLNHGAPGSEPSVVLSPLLTQSDEILFRHKTTARALYDSELARVTALGHFDALFMNEKGELTEGARSNLFIEKDGQLLTPHLDAGLLNGVLRQRLLRTGKAVEMRLGPDDLLSADALFMGNGLRGLLRVRLAPTEQTPPD